MTYKTNNLDLAAYLVTKGNAPKVKYIHTTMGEFIFAGDLTKQAAKFYSGEAQVNLLKFIANRLMLKKALVDNGTKVGIIRKTTNKYAELVGSKYWYLDTNNNPVMAVFGKQVIHSERKDAGNVYATLEEANAAKLKAVYQKQKST